MIACNDWFLVSWQAVGSMQCKRFSYYNIIYYRPKLKLFYVISWNGIFVFIYFIDIFQNQLWSKLHSIMFSIYNKLHLVRFWIHNMLILINNQFCFFLFLEVKYAILYKIFLTLLYNYIIIIYSYICVNVINYIIIIIRKLR